jgi:hypothetical protein
VPCQGYPVIREKLHSGYLFFSRYRKEREAFEEMEESDGERAAGTDTAEERAIRAMPIVTASGYPDVL